MSSMKDLLTSMRNRGSNNNKNTKIEPIPLFRTPYLSFLDKIRQKMYNRVYVLFIITIIVKIGATGFYQETKLVKNLTL